MPPRPPTPFEGASGGPRSRRGPLDPSLDPSSSSGAASAHACCPTPIRPPSGLQPCTSQDLGDWAPVRGRSSPVPAGPPGGGLGPDSLAPGPGCAGPTVRPSAMRLAKHRAKVAPAKRPGIGARVACPWSLPGGCSGEALPDRCGGRPFASACLRPGQGTSGVRQAACHAWPSAPFLSRFGRSGRFW